MNGELRSIDRYGRWVLLAVFLVLLGGRFTLDRLGAFPALDLRWGGLVVVGFLCLAWATVARERTTVARVGALFGWFLAWAGYMALSASWAPAGARAAATALDLLLLVALVWAGWGVAGRVHPRVLRSVWWWLYAAGWLYFVGALAGGPDVQGRYSAFGGGPNVFVRVMALAVLAALFLAISRRRHLVLVGLPLFLYGAYLSGSRGGLLALVVVVLAGAVPLARRMSRKTVGTLVLGAAPVVLLAPFLDWSWLGVMRERFLVQTFQEGYDSGRTEILERSLSIFDEHLWIGAGLDGFYALQGNVSLVAYPHNLIAASAAEGGLIGLGLILAALAAGFIALRGLRPLNPDALGFGLAALFMLVAAMFSGDYYDSRFLWFFLGLAVIAARRGSAGVEVDVVEHDRRRPRGPGQSDAHRRGVVQRHADREPHRLP